MKPTIFIAVSKRILKTANKYNPANMSVCYSKKALKEIKSPELGTLLNDVFIDCKKPALEFSSQKINKRSFVSMSIKDDGVVISKNNVMLDKGRELLEFLPETLNRTTKAIFNKKEIKEILDNDIFLQKFFSKYLKNAKEPTLELASKTNDKYNVAVIALKDGEKTLLDMACSKPLTENVVKYHFVDEVSRSTGSVENGKLKLKVNQACPQELVEKIRLFGSSVLNEREFNVLRLKYGVKENYTDSRYLGGMTIEQVAKTLNLKPKRAEKVLYRALEKLENANLDELGVNQKKNLRKKTV